MKVLKVSRPQLREILSLNSHSQAAHWVRKANLEVVERGGKKGMVFFNAYDLLVFFKSQKYITHAQNLTNWINQQQVGAC